MDIRTKLAAIVATVVLLGGCSSTGNTYGTGANHEEETIKSIVNLFAFRQEEKPDIDYSARPDLVMPSDANNLPAPTEQAAVEENWPVDPESRIAAIRAAAPQPDERSGELPVEYLTSEKEGIANSADRVKATRTREKDGGGFIDAMRNDANGLGESVEARKRREQLAYSTGSKRKFLTEPPVEYRTPSANSEAGDLGFDDEVLEQQRREAEREKKREKAGHWIE